MQTDCQCVTASHQYDIDLIVKTETSSHPTQTSPGSRYVGSDGQCPSQAKCPRGSRERGLSLSPQCYSRLRQLASEGRTSTMDKDLVKYKPPEQKMKSSWWAMVT